MSLRLVEVDPNTQLRPDSFKLALLSIANNARIAKATGQQLNPDRIIWEVERLLGDK